MPTPDSSLTRRDKTKKFDRTTGALHIFQLRKFRGYVLEVEDVHFHHDSAVLLPDYKKSGADVPPDDAERITGLTVLRACYRYAERNPSQKLLIVGHTDTSGSGGYNIPLSQMRADGVLHALMGNKDEWVKIALKKHKVEDYQQILKWVAGAYGWNCDPGPVDNVLGSKTKAATKEFQKTYNQEFNASIGEDGTVGQQTWGAFFDVYIDALKKMLETNDAGLAALRQRLQFVDSGRKTVGCGENFPIEAKRFDNYRSQINRRVEILFFDPPEVPPLNCHPRAGACVPQECELYNPKIYVFIHIPVEPLLIDRWWVVRVLKAGLTPLDQRAALANKAFVVTGAGGPEPEVRGTTDADGVLRVKVYDDPCTMTLDIEGKKITLHGGALPVIDAGDEALKRRLHNLGYGSSKFEEWDQDIYTAALKRFQKENGVSESGTGDAPTKDKLRVTHGS